MADDMSKMSLPKSFASAVILSLGCTFHSGQIWAEKTINLAWGEWPPMYGQALPKGGVQAHIVREAYAAVGLKINHQPVPWKRAFIMTKNGDIDGSPGWMKIPEREVDVLFSDPIAKGCLVYFHKRDTAFDWKTEEDLAGWSIGSTTGYTQTEKLKALQKSGIKFNHQITSQDLANMKKLLSGRIDLFVSNKDLGNLILRQNFSPEQIKSITTHPKPMRCDSLHAIFPRKTPEKSQRLITLFNKGLKQLHESGRYKQIMKAFDSGAYDPKK